MLFTHCSLLASHVVTLYQKAVKHDYRTLFEALCKAGYILFTNPLSENYES
jgi:hypothetical protein